MKEPEVDDYQFLVEQALRPYGFVMGRYGDAPFCLQQRWLVLDETDYLAKFNVIVDGRIIAQARIAIDGCVQVDMLLSEWMRQQPRGIINPGDAVYRTPEGQLTTEKRGQKMGVVHNVLQDGTCQVHVDVVPHYVNIDVIAGDNKKEAV